MTNPLFFIGCPAPSNAKHFERCMVSVNSLQKRQSDFQVQNWMLDSGAFTELLRFGHFRRSLEEYAAQVKRWSCCGSLLAAVSQDWMCEPFILQRTGLTVKDHQRLTLEHYDALVTLIDTVQLMPVLQGNRVYEYLQHLDKYGDRLQLGHWVGVGSICKRNDNPDQIIDILSAIKSKRPDLKLHGFGLKLTALEHKEVRALLYSCDSMAWSYPKRFGSPTSELELAEQYLDKIHQAVTDNVQKRTPVTAGPGNGQGRKPKWKHNPTTAIRIPAQFANQLIEVARDWDAANENPVRIPLISYKNEAGPSNVLPQNETTAPVVRLQRPALRYYGSKFRLADWILKYLPDHTCYCEPYCGSAAVLLRKPASDFEILNDLDGNVITFYRVLRDRPEELIRAIALTPYAREEQLLSYQETEDELEKARRFFVRSWQGFGGGCKRQTGWRYMFRNTRSQSVTHDWNHIDHLWQVAARLRQVQIECHEALTVIQRYDTPDTVFLIDPPYVQSTRGSRSKETYFFEMTDSEHRFLAELLHSIQGKAIVCGYPSALYEELYQGWQRVTCQAQTLTSQTATECLWVCPKAWKGTAQLQLFEQVI